MSRAYRAIAVLIGLAGVAIVVVAGSRTWATVTLPGLNGMNALPLPGRHAAPSATPIALAAGAAVIVMAISGRVVRFLVAAALVAGGVLVVLGSQDARSSAVNAATKAVEASVGMFNQNSVLKLPPDVLAGARASSTVWPLVSLAGGVLLVLSGVLGLVTGLRWPGPAPRFEPAVTGPAGPDAGGGPVGAPPETAAGAGPLARDDARTWDALSRGDDPT